MPKRLIVPYSSPTPTWLQRTFNPFIDIPHDIADTFKPYKTKNEILYDFLLPSRGLKNFSWGIMVLLFAPLNAVYDKMVWNRGVLSGYVSRTLNGLSHILVGAGQILLSPIILLSNLFIKGIIITPLDNIARWLKTRKTERLTHQLDTINPTTLNSKSRIRISKESYEILLPQELLTVISTFMTPKEMAMIRGVSKQVYSALNPELLKRFNSSLYYVIGYKNIVIAVDFDTRKSIKKEELLKSFNDMPEDEHITLFNTAAEVKAYARSIALENPSNYYNNDGDLIKTHPPVFHVLLNSKPQNEATSVRPLALEKSITLNPKVSFFTAPKKDLTLLRGQALRMRHQYPEEALNTDYLIKNTPAKEAEKTTPNSLVF